ncbi:MULTISPECIES: imelysin family protein [unclassified Nitratiruptor]|uniref:imelysin family protein n=1 Tax=unclassified Nitratiruptor TaxID=2624044 RepID=UPI0018EBDC18|nr:MULTISPECIES: imelysin family protein [unclassified Nitratiruptor]BCD61155.1 hypothetical protein NitYY0810_P17 [Nitratiruptor sp. YY08-10]BCD65088.1 hypothetical protein NitYY0814_P17 [Nitratiruptor sp. YY08-14]
MKKMVMGMVAGFILSGTLLADSGINKVKEFELEHATKLYNEAKKLKDIADDYYEDIKAFHFNYDKAWKQNKKDLTKDIEEMKRAWLEASSNYEIIEGLVAGMPQTAKYDLILDAGIPASEGNEDVAPFDLKCPYKCKFNTKRPGNFFHYLLEPTLWGTHEGYVAKKVDLNGDGEITKGEALPNAKWLKCVADNFEKYTKELKDKVKNLKMNLTDVFTAELTMIPTMGDYFEDWKNSRILGKSEAFVALSRIFDIKGISGGLKVAYEAAIHPKLKKVDPKLDSQIRLAFYDLVSFVDDIYMKEQSGHIFKPEDADAYASQAQDMADRLSALMAKAAKKLHIKPNV